MEKFVIWIILKTQLLVKKEISNVKILMEIKLNVKKRHYQIKVKNVVIILKINVLKRQKKPNVISMKAQNYVLIHYLLK